MGMAPRSTASDERAADPRHDSTSWAAVLALVAAGVVGAAQIGKGSAALPVLQDEFSLSSAGCRLVPLRRECDRRGGRCPARLARPGARFPAAGPPGTARDRGDEPARRDRGHRGVAAGRPCGRGAGLRAGHPGRAGPADRGHRGDVTGGWSSGPGGCTCRSAPGWPPCSCRWRSRCWAGAPPGWSTPG